MDKAHFRMESKFLWKFDEVNESLPIFSCHFPVDKVISKGTGKKQRTLQYFSITIDFEIFLRNKYKIKENLWNIKKKHHRLKPRK